VLRLLRERLREWIEDLRSIGGFDALADAVTQQLDKLNAAIARPDNLASDVSAIATELARLAADGAPPPPAKGGRVAFWK